MVSDIGADIVEVDRLSAGTQTGGQRSQQLQLVDGECAVVKDRPVDEE
jgi:hypothetical protein